MRVPSSFDSSSKAEMRRLAGERRRAQVKKDEVSSAILARLVDLPEYRAANTVLWYVHVRDEVRTLPDLEIALRSGKKIVVPFCENNHLGLFHLTELAQLAPAAFGILEPRAELRTALAHHCDPHELDFLMIPGLAFDRRGTRLGYGRGHFDRLLPHTRPDSLRIALAFECQIYDHLPAEPHDVPMHKIVTEAAVYDCS